MDVEDSSRRHAAKINGTRITGISEKRESKWRAFLNLWWPAFRPVLSTCIPKGNYIVLDFLGDLKRTHYCGALRASDAGKPALVLGWVARRRDLGNLLFLDVRDRTGIVQVVFNKETQPEAHGKAEHLRSEFVVGVVGDVIK